MGSNSQGADEQVTDRGAERSCKLGRCGGAAWPGRRGRPWKAGIATSAGKESNLPAGSNIGKQQMLTAALTGRIT